MAAKCRKGGTANGEFEAAVVCIGLGSPGGGELRAGSVGVMFVQVWPLSEAPPLLVEASSKLQSPYLLGPGLRSRTQPVEGSRKKTTAIVFELLGPTSGGVMSVQSLPKSVVQKRWLLMATQPVLSVSSYMPVKRAWGFAREGNRKNRAERRMAKSRNLRMRASLLKF